jgi:plastocyanin
MHGRAPLISLLVALLTLGVASRVPAAPAPTAAKRVIEITMTSFKFEPNQLRLNDGETVIVRLKNIDPFGRRHNFATSYLASIPITVRGDAVDGTSEGRRFVTVDAGTQADVEFTVRNRGSYAFLCTLFDHAEKGQTGTMLVRAAPAP